MKVGKLLLFFIILPIGRIQGCLARSSSLPETLLFCLFAAVAGAGTFAAIARAKFGLLPRFACAADYASAPRDYCRRQNQRRSYRRSSTIGARAGRVMKKSYGEDKDDLAVGDMRHQWRGVPGMLSRWQVPFGRVSAIEVGVPLDQGPVHPRPVKIPRIDRLCLRLIRPWTPHEPDRHDAPRSTAGA